MKIKDEIIVRCNECGVIKRVASEAQYGCDYCKNPIDMEDNKYGNKCSTHLRATFFYYNDYDNEKTEDLTFCSWKCFYNKMREYKNRKDIDFISFPALTFGRDIRDKYCGDFFDCIKEE